MRLTPARRAHYYSRQAEVMEAAGLHNVADRYRLLAAEARAEIKPACSCCHTPISAPESIARGLGPKCAGKRS